jgi:hypothetical protein
MAIGVVWYPPVDQQAYDASRERVMPGTAPRAGTRLRRLQPGAVGTRPPTPRSMGWPPGPRWEGARRPTRAAASAGCVPP